jgi:hypothetical protein
VEPARPERPRADRHTLDTESAQLGDHTAKMINTDDAMKDPG